MIVTRKRLIGTKLLRSLSYGIEDNVLTALQNGRFSLQQGTVWPLLAAHCLTSIFQLGSYPHAAARRGVEKRQICG